MSETLTLTLTPDEAGILADALEADLEGYVESAKDARESGSSGDVTMFKDAALRVQALLTRVRELIGEDD